jgi:hypothetical protein
VDDLIIMQLWIVFFSKPKATFTKAINAGTSTNGPITPAKACPLLIPNTPMATAMPIRNCFRRCKGNSGTFRIVGTKVLPHETQHKHQSKVDNERCDSNHIIGFEQSILL